MSLTKSAPRFVQLNVPSLETFPREPIRPDLPLRIEAAATQRTFLATFGLELKAAALAARRGSEKEQRAFIRFASRPAIEPALLVAWSRVTDRDTRPTALLQTASVLIGGKAQMASGRMRTAPDFAGQATLYAPPVQRDRWEETLREGRSKAPCPISRALFPYFVMILCHPLQDGNGRVGRALILGSLCADGLIQGPQIPLGPAFYRRAGQVAETMRALSATGDWTTAFGSLAGLLEAACEDAEAVAAAI